MLPLKLDYSRMRVQNFKDLLLNLETIYGCCSNAALKLLSLRRVCSTFLLRYNGKLKDGCVVEEGNVVTRAGGDKGVNVDFLRILGVKFVGVHSRRTSTLVERKGGGRLIGRVVVIRRDRNSIFTVCRMRRTAISLLHAYKLKERSESS